MPLLETDLPGLPKRRGKVRDVYDLGNERLLIIATDRISAFDWILPTPIPDKGRILTALSDWWFDTLGDENHRIASDIDAAGLALKPDVRESLKGRSMVVKKAAVVPFECVVRGYLSGSGWKEYQKSQSVCGEKLSSGLREGDRIDPIFTPATKAESGHDENVSFAVMAKAVGESLASQLKNASLDIYRRASQIAMSTRESSHGQGVILADTKFEWGLLEGRSAPILVDEVLTPDSSRYWPVTGYKPGGPQPSFDKQFVRDYLETTGWDKQSPPPPLPSEVVAVTRQKYIDCFEILTGTAFPWK